MKIKEILQNFLLGEEYITGLLRYNIIFFENGKAKKYLGHSFAEL